MGKITGRKKGVILFFIFSAFLSVAGFLAYRRANTQTVLMRARTESAVTDPYGSGSWESRTYRVEKGKKYRVRVVYGAVPRKGSGLFRDSGDGTPVYVGCSEMEQETVVVPVKPRIRINVELAVGRNDLAVDGGTFDMGTEQLRPVVTVEERTTVNESVDRQ